MVEAVSTVPRLETQLYLDYQGEDQFLQPLIPEATMVAYTEELMNLLKDQQIGPELRVQDFDDYMHLINGEVN